MPSMDISIFSGLRHYSAGGYLSRNTLYRADEQPIMHLDPSKTGFFIPQKGIQAPETYTTQANSIYYVPSSSINTLEIVLPPFDRKAARDYEKIPTPQEPILTREELGPSGSSTGSIASEPRPVSPNSEL